MGTASDMRKEIKNHSNEEIPQMNDENKSSPQKIVLKKNIRHLIQNNNNNIENENIINKESKDNNINDKKRDKIEKNNPKEEKGYLDDDLDDEDNIKLYLRVIKRMEKTYGVPIISAKIPGEQIKDIEIEEEIRPILINNEKVPKENKDKNLSNKKNIYIDNIENNNIKPNVIGYKIQQKIERSINNNKNNRIRYNYNTREINKQIYKGHNPINYNLNNKTPNYKNIISNNRHRQYISNSQNKAKISRPYQYIYKSQNIYNNNNINRPHQYIYDSHNKNNNINNNRPLYYSINNNSPSYNKSPKYTYLYKKIQRNTPNRKLSDLSNIPFNNYFINSKLISNKIPNRNNQSREYLYECENPVTNLHKKYENVIPENNDNDNIYKIMYRTRYHHGKSNNLIGSNSNEYCSNPIELRKYNNVGKSLQLYDNIQRISPRKYNNCNFNRTRKTYCIHNNRESIHWYAKINDNDIDTNFSSNVILKNGNPIIPKSTYISKYKNSNVINRYYSSLSFVPNNIYKSPNYLNHNKRNYLNYNNKFKELLHKYNNRRRNIYNSPNLLNTSHKNIKVDILKRKLGNSPSNYLEDVQLNFSYGNNSFNFEDNIPHGEEYRTYCIY